MKAPLHILIVLSLLNLGAVGLLALKFSKVEALVVGSPRQAVKDSMPSAEPPPIAAQKPAALPSDTPDPLAGLDLKKASDIKKRTHQMPPNLPVEEVARVVAEMDEWVFVPEEEEAASKTMSDVVEELRHQIAAQISALSKIAIEAPNGKNASEKMGQINSLLNLYPTPKTDEQRTKLERITSEVLFASRRVEDIRRLRYNAWAIAQIEAGLTGYYNKKKTIGTDEDALTKSCIGSMNVIDPAFLEPAALDLYNYVFGLTRDAVSVPVRVQLAKGFADATTTRKAPSDF